MNMITQHISVHKHFLIIDSPISFRLVANNGTDEVYRMAGAWSIDLWKLLPERYEKQYPVYQIDMVYDDDLLNGREIVINESNIDLGSGIAGVNGQDVVVTNFSALQNLYPLQIIEKEKYHDKFYFWANYLDTDLRLFENINLSAKYFGMDNELSLKIFAWQGKFEVIINTDYYYDTDYRIDTFELTGHGGDYEEENYDFLNLVIRKISDNTRVIFSKSIKISKLIYN